MRYVFADYELDTRLYELRHAGQPCQLEPQVFNVLLYLIQHRDQVVTKDELLEQLWPKQFISEVTLNHRVMTARKAIGDSGREQRCIKTFHRRGYRFIAPVVEHPAAVSGAPETLPLPTLDLPQPPETEARPVALAPPVAERRHLTVLCGDLVGSTALAGRLDPEEYREVVRAYHQTCAAVVQRFDGYVAQYLGDGVLVYFGYPMAHEDDALRAVRAGLALLDAVAALTTHPALPPGESVALRLGVHTGLVVIDAVGEGSRPEPLALGETPNIAARLRHLAAPNTLVLSAATHQLVAGYVRDKALGAHTLQGLAQPLEVYRVLGVSGAQSRLAVAALHGLTPLVGREQEVALLTERWTHVTEGMGQVVLLTGEAGIGKSRLVQVLIEHVAEAGHVWLECQGSPYYQHTALHPLIELLERAILHCDREEPPPQKLAKLEGCLRQYGLPLAEIVPLLAALFSLPLPSAYAPVSMSPEQQKQHTLHALLRLLLCMAAPQPLLLVMEDLHWVDPSTLEWLNLLVDQGPTARLLVVCTTRPDFQPSWTGRAHCTQMTLPRLPARLAAALTHQVAHGKALPAEVVAQLVAKTDGVPLFVEEMTKTVLESGLLQEHEAHYTLTGSLPPLAIPVTLHDALLARLDRLEAAKSLAQLGATLGRECAYGLLLAVAPWDEATVRQGLQHLVDAELLYQRGVPPQATYVFKHALIQDAAYQSLLKRTRQQYHTQIAQVLEARFPETVATQPELVAQHYTAAGRGALAVPYWQAAGQRASQRSAYVEAREHLNQGLLLLQTLPDTPERLAQEVALHLTLGPVLIATRGFTSPEVEQTYARARRLCQQLGETPQRFPALFGLWHFFWMSCTAGLQPARQLATELLAIAQQQGDTSLLLQAHTACGLTFFHTGELAAALAHLEAGQTLYDPQQHHALAFSCGEDLGMGCFAYGGVTRCLLGYSDQALTRCDTAVRLMQAAQHPFSLALAHLMQGVLHQLRREPRRLQEQVTALLALATYHGFPHLLAESPMLQGWACAALGQGAEGLTQIRASLALQRTMGILLSQTDRLGLLADACLLDAQPTEGLAAIAEALALQERSGEAFYTAELYRLQGELVRQMQGNPRPEAGDLPSPEACFQQALAVARRQQAKSWELRAAMSLARLWQHQGKRAEARALLAPLYNWFTEGFDTPDLQEARALLEALG